jgi:hypothetical protein
MAGLYNTRLLDSSSVGMGHACCCDEWQEDRVLNLLELHAVTELRAPSSADSANAANAAAMADGGWAGGAGPLRACACWAIGQVCLIRWCVLEGIWKSHREQSVGFGESEAAPVSCDVTS